MSFSDDVRQELQREQCDRACCARAEMIALLLCSGGITIRGGGRYVLSVSSEHASVVRYAFGLVKLHLGVAPSIRTARSAQLGGHVKYQLTFDEAQSGELLDWLDLKDASAPFGVRMTPPGALSRRDCCRRAYLKGAFLACGWVSAPEKTYHLEFAVPDQTQADHLLRVLRRCGVALKAVERKNQMVVYLKDGEKLATVLKLLGAHQALLALENVRIFKGVRNAVNRQVNCDAGNLDKTVDAAQRQMADIELIRDRVGLYALPEPLRQIAELRLLHADASLTELGEMLVPTLGKSGVNNRLRRLSALADEMRVEDGEQGAK